MATYWRISNHRDLSGKGGLAAGARWHTVGQKIVYMTESPTAAILEALVHLDGDGRDMPDFYNLLQISVPVGTAIHEIDPPGDAWPRNENLTRRLGDAWLKSRKTLIARVPSVIAPKTWNYLLNPEHPNSASAEIVSVIRERFDTRLRRFSSR